MHITAAQEPCASTLLRLLVPVVALLVHALQVATVEEQRSVALVRRDVIDHVRRPLWIQPPVMRALTQRLALELLCSEVPPSLRAIQAVVRVS